MVDVWVLIFSIVFYLCLVPLQALCLPHYGKVIMVHKIVFVLNKNYFWRKPKEILFFVFSRKLGKLTYKTTGSRARALARGAGAVVAPAKARCPTMA